MTTEKPVYHVSRLGSFEFCGYAYLLGEIMGRSGLGSFWSCRGSGTHAARKANLRQKVKTGVDLPLESMLDAARDEVNRQVRADVIDLTTGPLAGKSKQSAAGIIIDTTLKIVEVDRRQLQRFLRPLIVEVPMKIKLADWPFDIGLTFDTVDDKERIVDCKTSRTKWKQEKSDAEYQPSVYTLGFRAHYGHDPKGFVHHCLICTKSGRIYAYPLTTSRNDRAIIAVLNRFSAMHDAITQGVFAPAHQSSWKCSTEWCKFFHECKYTGA